MLGTKYGLDHSRILLHKPRIVGLRSKSKDRISTQCAIKPARPLRGRRRDWTKVKYKAMVELKRSIVGGAEGLHTLTL